MNFEPADFTKDVSLPGRNPASQLRNNQTTFQSPLLQTKGMTKFNKNSSSNMQNKSNSSHYNGTVYNRLGSRNINRNNNMSNDKSNNDRGETDNRNFNRKRSGDNNVGPVRKWRNKRPFYQNSNSANNMAQNRLNRVRSSSQQNLPIQSTDSNNIGTSVGNDPNESLDFDPTDITVEVINQNAQPKEESNPTRFKMILDPKAQAAIKMIQQKRKDKQVIFPFPVSPNVTEISLNERFALL